jgi:hypothetical protein
VEADLEAEGDLLLATEVEKPPAQTLAELITDLEDANKGNTLVAELVTARPREREEKPGVEVVRPNPEEVPGAAEAERPTLPAPAPPAPDEVQAKARLDTAYVVQGRLEKRLKVVRDL